MSSDSAFARSLSPHDAPVLEGDPAQAPHLPGGGGDGDGKGMRVGHVKEFTGGSPNEDDGHGQTTGDPLPPRDTEEPETGSEFGAPPPADLLPAVGAARRAPGAGERRRGDRAPRRGVHRRGTSVAWKGTATLVVLAVVQWPPLADAQDQRATWLQQQQYERSSSCEYADGVVTCRCRGEYARDPACQAWAKAIQQREQAKETARQNARAREDAQRKADSTWWELHVNARGQAGDCQKSMIESPEREHAGLAVVGWVCSRTRDLTHGTVVLDCVNQGVPHAVVYTRSVAACEAVRNAMRGRR